MTSLSSQQVRYLWRREEEKGRRGWGGLGGYGVVSCYSDGDDLPLMLLLLLLLPPPLPLRRRLVDPS